MLYLSTGALATYRPSLRRRSRNSIETNEKRLMRSRQQWVSTVILFYTKINRNFPQKYDRRGRRVDVSEKEKWMDLTPAVMSDIGQNTFIIHRQDWRSPELDEFLEELDRHADAALKRAHPRKNRILGTPLKIPVRTSAKDWMVKENGSDAGRNSPPIF